MFQQLSPPRCRGHPIKGDLHGDPGGNPVAHGMELQPSQHRRSSGHTLAECPKVNALETTQSLHSGQQLPENLRVAASTARCLRVCTYTYTHLEPSHMQLPPPPSPEPHFQPAIPLKATGSVILKSLVLKPMQELL